MPNRLPVDDRRMRSIVKKELDKVEIHLCCEGEGCHHEVVITRESEKLVAGRMRRHGWGIHLCRLLCPLCLFRAIGHYRVDLCAACDKPLQSDETGPFGSDCAKFIEHLDLSRDFLAPYPPAWRTRSQKAIRRDAANEAWKTRRARERKSMPSESPAG